MGRFTQQDKYFCVTKQLWLRHRYHTAGRVIAAEPVSWRSYGVRRVAYMRMSDAQPMSGPANSTAAVGNTSGSAFPCPSHVQRTCWLGSVTVGPTVKTTMRHPPDFNRTTEPILMLSDIRPPPNYPIGDSAYLTLRLWRSERTTPSFVGSARMDLIWLSRSSHSVPFGCVTRYDGSSPAPGSNRAMTTGPTTASTDEPVTI